MSKDNRIVAIKAFHYGFQLLNSELEEGARLLNAEQNPNPEIAIKASQGIPALVLLSLCIEISLKELIYQTQGNDVKGHDLYKLFNGLDDDMRTIIREKVMERIDISQSDFDNTLEENAKTFMDWRYFYEKNTINGEIRFLKHFEQAIIEEIL